MFRVGGGRKYRKYMQKIQALDKSCVFAILYFTNVVTGTLGIVLVVLGAVFVLTSLVSFCPLYLPFGISTCKTKE